MRFNFILRLSKATSTIAPKIGIIAAQIVGVTGSDNF